MKFSVTSSRRNLIALAVFVIVTFFANYYYFSSSLPSLPKFTSVSTSLSSWLSKPTTPSTFWHEFAPLLAAAKPTCKKPILNGHAMAKDRYADSSWVGGKPKNRIDMSGEDLDNLKASHELMVETILYEAPELDYVPGTTGIVTSAGGAYFPVLLTSLLMLRRTGSALPLEVFLATAEEYEPQMCDVVLPSLNAKCIILTDLLASSTLPFEFKHFQLKIFAILFSSFESVLFLDADNFPVHPPEELFLSEPFTSHHLVLWPDFWSQTFSPYLNKITGVPSDLLYNRPTIEAGQLLVSKPHHKKTLLLSAYYNAYGDYYYDLMTQGGPGQGDKSTFATAALVLSLPFYTINQGPSSLGTPHDGAAVLQFDPSVDYSCNQTCHPRPFFIHASWPPKLNALSNIRDHRQWGSEENSRTLFEGVDIEPVAWGFMVEMACIGDLEFWDWGEGNKSSTGVCEQVKGCFRNMFGREYERVQR